MTSYLLEAAAYWLGFYALYHFLLRKERFFDLNRFYLLITLVAGLLFPLLEWSVPVPAPEWVSAPMIWLETVTVGEQAVTAAARTWTWQDVLFWVYLLGCTVALLRLVRSIYLVVREIRAGEVIRKDGISWVRITRLHTPFSWFGYLFWSEDLQLEPAEKATIVAHERSHIRLGHSYDILMLEIIGLFFWWNPLWYAYRQALGDVHEFQADAAALRQTPIRDYGHLLIRQSLGRPQLALIQTFHTSQLKQRIAMMTKQPSRPVALLKYLLLLPVGALVFLACDDSGEKEAMAEVADVVEFNPAFQMVDTIIMFDPESGEESRSIVRSDVFEKVEEMPVFGTCGNATAEERFNCSTKNLMQFVYENVKYPEAAERAGEEGMAVVKFVVDSSGEVLSASIAKSSESASIDAEALRVAKELPAFQPGMIDGKPVNVQLALPIRFKLD